jgi:uncharacterized damage-inducible protein DinB
MEPAVSAPTATSTFPDVYAGIPTARLLEAYAAGPDRLRAAVAGLEASAWTARPRPVKWSIREITLHVTDSELVGTGRSRLAFAQPGSGFYVYDESGWAQAFDYQHAAEVSVELSLALFEALRAYQLPVFAGATGSQWQQAALHPNWGSMTLRNLLELYADHSERHIGQILENRRLLGLELALPSLLPTRLY